MSHARFYFLFILACIFSTAFLSALDTDKQGRQVRDKFGRRINYDHDSNPYVFVSDEKPSVAGKESLRIHQQTSREIHSGKPYQRVLSKSPSAFDPALMHDQASTGSINQDLGVTGIYTLDVDNDAIPEILVGHTSMWYLLRYEPERDSFVQAHFHEAGTGCTFGCGDIKDLHYGDVDGDGELEVVVLFVNDSISVYDARTGNLEGSQALGISVEAIATGELDPTPGSEIAALTNNGVYVFTFGSTTPLWSNTSVGGVDMQIGNVDSDSAAEIVYTAGSSGALYAIDSATHSIEYVYANGGDYVDVGDIDGDQKDEVVTVEFWGNYLAVDMETETQKWIFPNFNSSAIAVGDVNEDGIGEVLLGDAQWGSVKVLDGNTGNTLKQITNPEHSVSFIATGDVNGDCKTDVLWGAGFTSSGNDRLFIADPVTATIFWENIETDGPMHCFNVADIDNDGQTELVWCSGYSDATYKGALVFVTDLHHGYQEYIPTDTLNDGWMDTRGMLLLQADGDPQLEIIMNASTTYSGKVGAFDGVDQSNQWISTIFDGEYINALASGDVDGNGSIDVVVGTGREHTGALGTFVRVLRLTDGALLWQSASLTDSWGPVQDVRVADIDSDGTTEILVVTTGDGLRIFDGITHAEEWFYSYPTVTALETGDLDGDGDLDILLADANGQMTAFDGITHATLFQTSVVTTQINAILLADIDQDSAKEILFTYDASTGSGSFLRMIKASDRSFLWESDSLSGHAGDSSSLKVVDADDDGKEEILVSTGQTVRVYEYSSGPADVVAPVFEGSPGIQSVTAGTCCPRLDLDWNFANDDSSPPVTYRVYRDTVPLFVAGSQFLITQTGLTSYRDHNVTPGVTYYYIVHAVDTAGNEDTNTVSLSATPVSSVFGTPSFLPEGTVNQPYNQTITGNGGTAPYTFQISLGTLPPGLSLATDGNISGTPSTAGQYGVTIKITDSAGCETNQGFVIRINGSNCPVITILPNSLPDGMAGQPYSQQLSASGGSAPYTFNVVVGSLPAGISLSIDGLISGTPVESGSFNFTVAAIDSMGCSGSQSYTLTINCPLIDINPDSLPDGTVGTPYNATLTATGGIAPYSFAVISGNLPSGVTLSSDGNFSGTPSVGGIFAFTVGVLDSAGCETSQSYSIAINGAPCLFCDDFEDGVLSPNWTYIKPSWSESAGSLNGSPTGRKAIAIATPIFSGCSTCNIQTVMRTAGGAGNRVWLLAWYISKGNTIELLMKEENDRWILKQRVNGKIVVKAKASQPIDPNTPYVVDLTYDGVNVILKVGGTQILSVAVNGTPNGTIGFQVKNTTAMFDSIQVN